MNAAHPTPESPDSNYQQALSAYLERGGEALLAPAVTRAVIEAYILS